MPRFEDGSMIDESNDYFFRVLWSARGFLRISILLDDLVDICRGAEGGSVCFVKGNWKLEKDWVNEERFHIGGIFIIV